MRGAPERPFRQTTAADVQTMARAAGLVLDTERTAALAPMCNALAEADTRLRAMPMTDGTAAGPPWGSTKRDGRR